jgi:hypothetical protein
MRLNGNTSKLDLHLRKKLVTCYILSIALKGADTRTLRKIDHKYLQILKYGAAEVWRRAIAPFL